MSNTEPQNNDVFTSTFDISCSTFCGSKATLYPKPQSSMYSAQLSKIPVLKDISPSYPKNILLKHEIETLGFFLSIHPLERYDHILKGLDYVKARDLQAWTGKMIRTVGWMVTGKTVRTKDGDSMKFVSFEDPTGIYEAVFFPKIYHQYCNMLNGSRAYILKGRVEEDFGAINIQVHWIGFLDSVHP